MRHDRTAPAPSTACGPPTLAVQADVHDAVLHLHVPAQVALEVELAGAVGALEGFATRVKVHVAQQVVHAVEGLPAHLEHTPPQPGPRQPAGLSSPGPQPLLLPWLGPNRIPFVLSYVTPEAEDWAPACRSPFLRVCPTLPEPRLRPRAGRSNSTESLAWAPSLRLHRDLHPHLQLSKGN